MPSINLGNIVGLLKSETPPTKKYVIWAKILNPSFPDIVELYYWDDIAGAWTLLTDSTTNYWLKPVITQSVTVPPPTPLEGDRYLIPTGASGVWSTHVDQVAHYKSGAWQYTTPLDGYIMSIRDEANKLYDYRGLYGFGGAWFVNDFQVPIAPGTYIPSTEKAAALGVATLDVGTKVPAAQINGATLPFTPASPGDWSGGMALVGTALDELRTLIASGTSDTDDWKRGGNTVGSISSMGTLDDYDVIFKRNNIESFRMLTGGNVGVGGLTTVDSKLQVKGELNSKAFKVVNSTDVLLFELGQTGGSDYATITADTVTIGRAGGVVNIIGTTNYNNVTNLNVSDTLITVNKGGGASSATDTGFEIEENATITGYFKTTADRNGYRFKAPNVASSATLTLASLTGSRTYTLPDTNGTIMIAVSGTANQILGVNNAGTANEFKTVSVSTSAVGNDAGVTLSTANALIIHLPEAGPGIIRGLLSNDTQTIAGFKRFSQGMQLTGNAQNTLGINTTFTAFANNDAQMYMTGVLTARGTASDSLHGVRFTNTLVAAAATQTLVGITLAPTFTPGAFSPTRVSLDILGTSSTLDLRVGGKVLVGGATVTNATAALVEFQSTTSGILMPRLSTAQRNAITSPITGLYVHNTNTQSLDFNNGTSWVSILGTIVISSNLFYGLSVGNTTVSGAGNVGFGNNVFSTLTSGASNVGFGAHVLTNLTTGDYNVGVGTSSLLTNIAGSGNVAVGQSALYSATSSNNVGIGYQAGYNITSGSGNIIIGHDVYAQSATDSDQLSIQNALLGAGNSSTGTTISSGNIGFWAKDWGTGSTRVISIASGTPPSTSTADAIQLYVQDIVAGNAALHTRTELGDIIRLYSAGGWGTPSNTISRTTFDTTTVTLGQLAEKVGALITDLKSLHGLLKA